MTNFQRKKEMGTKCFHLLFNLNQLLIPTFISFTHRLGGEFPLLVAPVLGLGCCFGGADKTFLYSRAVWFVGSIAKIMSRYLSAASLSFFTLLLTPAK